MINILGSYGLLFSTVRPKWFKNHGLLNIILITSPQVGVLNMHIAIMLYALLNLVWKHKRRHYVMFNSSHIMRHISHMSLLTFYMTIQRSLESHRKYWWEKYIFRMAEVSVAQVGVNLPCQLPPPPISREKCPLRKCVWLGHVCISALPYCSIYFKSPSVN